MKWVVGILVLAGTAQAAPNAWTCKLKELVTKVTLDRQTMQMSVDDRDGITKGIATQFIDKKSDYDHYSVDGGNSALIVNRNRDSDATFSYCFACESFLCTVESGKP